jgi:menaquinone-specific isochorismate synthase
VSDFAFLRLNENETVIGSGKSVWEKTPSKRGSFYFPDFFLDAPAPFLTFPKIKKVSLKLRGVKPIPQIALEPPQKEIFFEMMKGFKTSSLKKSVPYAFLSSKTKGSRSLFFKCSRALLKTEQKLSAYGFFRGDEALLGATPELLFRTRGSFLETVALAGTSFEGKEFTEKDYKEHAFVVKGLRETLGPLGDLYVGECSFHHLKTLVHLKTEIGVDLKEPLSFDFLIQALHPTAALGTYPKEMTLLRHYDTLLKRGRFGAPVGFVIPNSEAHVFVGIRNMQFDETGIKIGAGAGVIFESNEEEEWLEVLAKLEATKNNLGV